MTENPSSEELAKTYSPADAEEKISALWKHSNAFHSNPTPEGKKPFSIVIPPPNVTAALHLGHALNNTLQDVLTRYHRMAGFATMWMPGTDHAGIATQTVVEKRLTNDGTSRLEIGRDAFVRRTQEWKDEYEGIIIDQLVAMGASCDFDRTRFTMDEICANAVRHAFFTLFEDGLIYRGKRLVNWDPVTMTALADDEVEMEEVEGSMWYLKYPLSDGSGYVTVATTRPETMLGDTAVAVNPNDPAANDLVGKMVLLPIVNRLIPIIEDDYVVMADLDSEDSKARYASGFLKVTPGHDPNDWDIGLRHELPVINIMGPDASISTHYGWEDVSEEASRFVGLSREDAREAIIEWFENNNLLEDVRTYTHSVGHSYRSHVPIEPWLSSQWYVAVTDDRLRGSALRAQEETQVPSLPNGVASRSNSVGDGDLSFFPSRYARTYYSWHEGIRDWCISRQLWWGHQIPVWVRAIPESESPVHLENIDSGVGINIESEWTRKGAAHMVRKVGENMIEEAICVPPENTLKRIEAEMKISEPDLIAELEKDGFVRDPDVLDTWFSSALWPLSTMGWPWPEDFPETEGLLDFFNPTSVLSTAREIITLWVSRMVMFNRYFLDGQLPFRDVFIHAMVQDGHGQKMSKSLGNGVDPRDIIFSHGADAMRFTLVQMTTDTQDVRMPVEMVCPHTGKAFVPKFVTSSAGYLVAAPIQSSPEDAEKQMLSAFGFASGSAEPNEHIPLARNTSSKFDLGRNFANKLWNATRFALGRVSAASAVEVDLESRPFVDKWIVTRLGETITALEKALASYQFNIFADTLYDFVWHDVCDRYLEVIKPTIDNDPQQQVILANVLDAVLRIMHPVCPFVTETLWPHVKEAKLSNLDEVLLPDSDILALAAWPKTDLNLSHSEEILRTFKRADTLVSLIRSARAEQKVKPKQMIQLHVSRSVKELLSSTNGFVEVLTGVDEIHSLENIIEKNSTLLTFEGEEIQITGLANTVDIEAQKNRLAKLIENKRKQVDGFRNRLENPGYLRNAKPEIIAETKKMLEEAEADLLAAENSLENLT
ncbi:MAG: valine--tRNA ligase [Acidimicrobiales bacterium]|jgi:valyl-tRNA synthetase|nr:valine--tRNA ligase [Acidimicrobiales bacterium]MDP6298115.1 valine--tRNA ligase [Acidimicrobiales bacterium]HJM29363.1 valine--tRNA ligase [Acidimicrobiales bacterium]HJM96845.1 valine--tRNA ligase [Acidimicrobiales bacterium]